MYKLIYNSIHAAAVTTAQLARAAPVRRLKAASWAAVYRGRRGSNVTRRKAVTLATTPTRASAGRPRRQPPRATRGSTKRSPRQRRWLHRLVSQQPSTTAPTTCTRGSAGRRRDRPALDDATSADDDTTSKYDDKTSARAVLKSRRDIGGDARRAREPRGARARDDDTIVPIHSAAFRPPPTQQRLMVAHCPRPGRRGGWRGPPTLAAGRQKAVWLESRGTGPARARRRGSCAGPAAGSLGTLATVVVVAGRRRCLRRAFWLKKARKVGCRARGASRSRGGTWRTASRGTRTAAARRPGPWTAGCCCGRCERSTCASLAKVPTAQRVAEALEASRATATGPTLPPGSLRTRTTPSPKANDLVRIHPRGPVGPRPPRALPSVGALPERDVAGRRRVVAEWRQSATTP